MTSGLAAKQRQPRRHSLAIAASIFALGGVIFTLTLLGAVIGIPMLIISGIIFLIRSRIKMNSIECPSCKTPNKIELSVQYFNCEQCLKTVRKEQGEWVAAG